MTGLSRKYSIPLLELLGQHGRDPKERLRSRHPVVTPVQSSSRCCRQDEDSMGITRRKGSVRDIL
ncbi:MAG: SelB C-terminal domain-containing protein [Anaerotruncus sp.]|nr:SelB C-terminal domain-containing protein [Anaerotruncus sp.]